MSVQEHFSVSSNWTGQDVHSCCDHVQLLSLVPDYPQGKVVFLAPTKPLVAQQIEACYGVMGISQSHTAEMTGSMAPKDRQQRWIDKHVFQLPLSTW